MRAVWVQIISILEQSHFILQYINKFGIIKNIS